VSGVSAAKRLLVVVTVFIALAVGAPAGYWKQMGTILTPKGDYNYTELDGRKAVLERGIGYMKQYPAFGLGIDNFARAECTISPKLASLRLHGPRRCTPPHNSHLQAAAELGVPGLLIWLSLIIGGIFAPLRLRRRLPRSWRRGTESERFIYGATGFLAVAMVGFAVTSFFVSFAWMDTIYLMAALLTGLYISARVQFEGNDRSAAPRPPQIVSPNTVTGWRVRQSVWRSSRSCTA
jgi:O-antigen ligase